MIGSLGYALELERATSLGSGLLVGTARLVLVLFVAWVALAIINRRSDP